jgi:extracellular factor (EF) 3-hydroxypalmitic acid methyl ester biosynthesis protein
MENQPATSLEMNGMLTFQTNESMELRATLLRLNPEQVAFELYHPQSVIRNSEVLNSLRITLNDQPIYHGRAVVRSVVNTGAVAVCEATLSDPWLDNALPSLAGVRDRLRPSYDRFLHQWQNFYQVLPEFKILIADMNSYLSHLRIWLDHIELGIRSMPSGSRVELEFEVIDELSASIVPTLNFLFEKFERVAAPIPAESQPAHHSYLKRNLHPLMLCAPFAYRTYHKPLGYAGDYEMVNMILRDPREGGSLFAKLLNVWFVSQPPAEAHRNRVRYLTERIASETLRTRSAGRKARIFSLGCGPAGEVQSFLAQSELASEAEFLLLDFNDETLAYTGGVLDEIKRKRNLATPIQMVKKSVGQLLKAAHRSSEGSAVRHDLVYCAGLLDYLPDRICKDLVGILYDSLAPGGLLIVTNVDLSNPIQNMLDYLLEWHLIYRSGQHLMGLRPEKSHPEDASLIADSTGVNVILEVRKPA